MTTPRTKKMLLLAAATMATPVVVSSCSNERQVSGFYGDFAYDSGYEDTGTFGSTDASRTPANPEAGKGTDADTSDADVGDAAAHADADADADQ